jgi:hypothetical protein
MAMGGEPGEKCLPGAIHEKNPSDRGLVARGLGCGFAGREEGLVKE